LEWIAIEDGGAPKVRGGLRALHAAAGRLNWSIAAEGGSIQPDG